MTRSARTFDRRTLLKWTGGAALLAALPGRALYGWADDAVPPARTDGCIPMTFHEPVEVLICGSTLFACQLAIRTAQAGRRTMLVMDRVNPFLEGIACLRSWTRADAVPELLRGVCGNAATSQTANDRIYFNPSKAILDIEDRLCEAGVRFLYNAAVAGALGDGGRIAGVVFGGKTGLFAIEAGVVVDATAEATVARAAGARTVPQPGPRRYHYVADLAKPVAQRTARYTAADGARVAVDIHHYYAGFDVELDSRSSGPFALNDDFARVYAASLECPWEGGEKRFRGADAFLCSGVDRMEATTPGRVAGCGELFVYGPQGIPGNTDGSLVLRDPAVLDRAFPAAAAQVLAALTPVVRPRPALALWNRGVPAEAVPPPGLVHGFSDHGFDEPGTDAGTVLFTPPQVARTAEVLVAGGGTSGNAAAHAAAALGMKTLCLERGLELGGTNTIGGVTNLWFGNKTRAFADYYQAMGAANDGLNAPGFFRGLRAAGCQVLLGTAITGVARVGRMVQRVYVLTPLGLTAVEAPHTIDATGDGAIAAWAGCGYSFGGEHDEMTLWGSFAGFRPGHQEALRPFLSPCDERSAWDATRFILAMRCNSKITLDQPHVPPPFYLAPRESRHIRGGRTLTYLDTLAGRRFRDGVLRIESNPDIKGLATSDAAKAGFIPTNWKSLFQVTVPYAALIPTAIDNVIVAGKAYSVTHDALALARMQRDLCVMGMVAAEAVRLAAERRVLLRDVPIRDLQAILIAKHMLKASDVAEDDRGFPMPPEEMVRMLAGASDLDACLPVSAMLCLLPREQALALLAPHAAHPNPAMQRVLCFLGDRQGIDRYASQVEQALAEPALSRELYGGKGTSHLMPDQGYAPTAALMLGGLAIARSPRTVPLLVRLAGRVPLDDKDLRFAWGYLYTLACGFERMACAQGCEPLRRVLAAPVFQGRIIPRSGDWRATRNAIAERYTYLRMALARTLTRCGDVEGARALCGLLDESRLCFARAARAELVAATGRDFGFKADAWRAWLDASGAALKPQPLTTPFA